jgi:hypothetical protein
MFSVGCLKVQLCKLASYVSYVSLQLPNVGELSPCVVNNVDYFPAAKIGRSCSPMAKCEPCGESWYNLKTHLGPSTHFLGRQASALPFQLGMTDSGFVTNVFQNSHGGDVHRVLGLACAPKQAPYVRSS